MVVEFYQIFLNENLSIFLIMNFFKWFLLNSKVYNSSIVSSE